MVASSLVTIPSILGGCLEEETDDTPATRETGTQSSDDSAPTTQSSSDEDGSSSDGTTTSSSDEDEECFIETDTETEQVISDSDLLEGGYRWTYEYPIEADDRIEFSVSASDSQDVEVEILNANGHTVYNQTGTSLSPTETFSETGTGEILVTNLGERTEEEREEVWDEREDVPAGATLSPWLEINEGNSVEYTVREVSGARPKLVIENQTGDTLREHSVSSTISDTFTAPEDDRYYFEMENTAALTSGTWDYTFERVIQVSIDTNVELEVTREYEVEEEVCE